MKIIVPPIKSQGIKTKLVPNIIHNLPVFSGNYIEPFLGTGVVAFNIKPDKAFLSDINPHLINFYNYIKNINILQVKTFLEKEGNLLKNYLDNSYYNEIRSRFNNFKDPLDFLFLSRAGFNGMIRFNKKGNWNVPFCKKPNRFRKSYITKIINQIKNIQPIINKNWKLSVSSFETVIPLANKNDFIYLDPPYYSRNSDYFTNWTENNENMLFSLLNETKAKFMLSTWHHNEHRKNEMIDKYWNKFNIVTFNHFYHNGAKLSNRKPMIEALIKNF